MAIAARLSSMAQLFTAGQSSAGLQPARQDEAPSPRNDEIECETRSSRWQRPFFDGRGPDGPIREAVLRRSAIEFRSDAIDHPIKSWTKVTHWSGFNRLEQTAYNLILFSDAGNPALEGGKCGLSLVANVFGDDGNRGAAA